MGREYVWTGVREERNGREGWESAVQETGKRYKKGRGSTNIPVRSRSDELGNRVRERRVRTDVEDRERILAIVQATRGEDHGNEVDAGVV